MRLAVLVGPSTPLHRHRGFAMLGQAGEKLIAITRPNWCRRQRSPPARLFPVSQCDDKHPAGLSSRTSLERIAPESLTRALYGFVHGDIWQTPGVQPQDGVAQARFKRDLVPSNVNASLDSMNGSRVKRYWLLRLHTIGRGPRGKRYRDEFGRLEHSLADRRWALSAVRHQNARAGDWCQPDLHLALLGEVLDRRP